MHFPQCGWRIEVASGDIDAHAQCVRHAGIPQYIGQRVARLLPLRVAVGTQAGRALAAAPILLHCLPRGGEAPDDCHILGYLAPSSDSG